MSKDHRWVGKRYPNTPDGPGEYEITCADCGEQKPPSWPDIEIGECDPPPVMFYTKCNVCGIEVKAEDEQRMGMCERCARE